MRSLSHEILAQPFRFTTSCFIGTESYDTLQRNDDIQQVCGGLIPYSPEGTTNLSQVITECQRNLLEACRMIFKQTASKKPLPSNRTTTLHL